MKKIAILFCSLLFFPFGEINAQEPLSDYRHEFLVMGVPQHLFQNGIRIEFDKRLNSPRQWLTLAPTVYYRGQRGNWLWGNYNVYSMSGAGMEVFYRRYFKDLPQPSGFYFTGGGGYRFINQEFRGDRWDIFTENDLTFYRYNNSSWHKHTHTFSLKATAGFQTIISRHLMLDLFLGYGFMFSTHKIPGDVEVISQFTNAFSFDYTGFKFVGGMRLGIGW